MGTSSQILWSLYDQLEDHQIDGLLHNEILLVIKSIAPKNRGHWLAWKTGEKTWKTLLEFPELDPATKEEAPPVPTSRHDEEVTKTVTFIRVGEIPPSEENTSANSTLVLDDVDSTDRRSTTRYHKSFKVSVALNTDKAFVTRTVDASLEGLHLEESLPEESGELFRLELWRGDDHIELLCERADPANHTALRIRENPREQLYKKWLLG